MGTYTPALSPEEEEAYARAAKLFDVEEMERLAKTERDGCSLEELMQRLRSSEKA
jgi:hypothetical protein